MVIQRPDEKFHPNCIDKEWASGWKSLMVFGAFCGKIKSELRIILHGAKLDFAKYVTYVLDPI